MTVGEVARLKAATATFGASIALEDINLTVCKGDFLGIVGPSGAGKTTLLNLILGLVRPVAGTVTVFGCTARKAARDRRIRVGYVPQLETVDWSFPATAGEIALMGVAGRAPLTPWTRASDRSQMHEVFERTGIGGLEGRHIRDLSGGQRQRVFLARALLANPSLLLLDEATTGIDIAARLDLLDLLLELNGQGTTIVMATHDLNSVAAKVPLLACINRRLIAYGPPDDVFTSQVLTETFGNAILVIDHHGVPMAAELPETDEHRHHLHIHDNHNGGGGR